MKGDFLSGLAAIAAILVLGGLVLLVWPAGSQAAQRGQGVHGGEDSIARSRRVGAQAAQDVVTVTVGADGFRFSPADVEILAGATVRWVWATGGHTVTSGSNGVADGLFCSPNDQDCSATPIMGAGSVYETRFEQPGVFPYFCRPHFFAGMVGTITVATAVPVTATVYLPLISAD